MSAQSSPKSQTKLDPDALQELTESLATVGQINAIIRCKQHPDRILSGRHRVAAGASRHVDYDTDEAARRLGQTHEATEQIIRIHANTQRKVSEEERQAEFIALAETYHQDGTPKELCAQKVVEALGPRFTKVYIYSLLPERFKDARRTKAIRAGIARGKVCSDYSGKWGLTTTGEAEGQIKASAGSEDERQIRRIESLERGFAEVRRELESRNLIPGRQSSEIESLKRDIASLEVRKSQSGGTDIIVRFEDQHRMLGESARNGYRKHSERETVPFVQKVISNSMVQMSHEYAVDYHDGLADFPLNCISYFFTSYNIRIIIEKTY